MIQKDIRTFNILSSVYQKVLVSAKNRVKTEEDVITLEEQFFANQYNGNSEQDFFISYGTGCVLISAPHAVNHFRSGKIKYADMMTGGIALYINKITDCPAICLSRYVPYDTNWNEANQNPYQKALARYIRGNNIRLVIDLHGATKSRPYAAVIGVTLEIAGKNLKEIKIIKEEIREAFSSVNYGLKDFVMYTELGHTGQNTVSYFCN